MSDTVLNIYIAGYALVLLVLLFLMFIWCFGIGSTRLQEYKKKKERRHLKLVFSAPDDKLKPNTYPSLKSRQK